VEHYQEYIRRHAPIAPLTWLKMPKRDGIRVEVTGYNSLRKSDGEIQHITTLNNDGSISVWSIVDSSSDMSPCIEIKGKSKQGLLTCMVPGLQQDVAATNIVAVDSAQNKAYFAVSSQLHEIDLSTLQCVSTHTYGSPIWTLSEMSSFGNLLVGTNAAIHQYDTRFAQLSTSMDYELINAPSSNSSTILAQSGPLSIQRSTYDPASIWVAGRFTHILNYDIRSFSKPKSTIFSGAHINDLCYQNLGSESPCESDLIMAASPSNVGSLFAAGVYKGKGSLETYSIYDSYDLSTNRGYAYQNRQTASRTSLLSIVTHGGTIVASDSDGNINWYERNARHKIRSYNINNSEKHAHLRTTVLNPDIKEAGADVVKKIMPWSISEDDSGGSNKLLLLTSEGRLGILGYGKRAPVVQRRVNHTGQESSDFSVNEHYVVEEEEEEVDEEDDEYHSIDDERDVPVPDRAIALRMQERRIKKDAEKQYQGRLRRALENQANETRFMKGLGFDL